MTASSRSRVVLLRAAAGPDASPNAGPQPARIRRYRLARAHLQAQRTQQLAIATDAVKGRLHA